jgi:hypothetical protein
MVGGYAAIGENVALVFSRVRVVAQLVGFEPELGLEADTGVELPESGLMDAVLAMQVISLTKAREGPEGKDRYSIPPQS